jgi:hypothetical protein
MTAAQKTAKLKFKQAIAYRQKTGVTLKEAFAHIYGKKKVGIVKKKVLTKKKVGIVKSKPYKGYQYTIDENETGDFVDKYFTLTEAKKDLKKLESNLKKSGKYKKDFYRITHINTGKTVGKKIGYSKVRLDQEKGITKVLKNTPRTLFPYTAKEKIVKAGKKYFDEQAKKISGLYKIVGKVSNKYYVEFIHPNEYKFKEYFNVLPKNYYKGKDRILYISRLTNKGTALIPLKYTKTDKLIKK